MLFILHSFSNVNIKLQNPNKTFIITGHQYGGVTGANMGTGSEQLVELGAANWNN